MTSTVDTSALTPAPHAASRRITRVRRLGLAAAGAPTLVATAALVASTQDGFLGLWGGLVQAALLLPVMLVGVLLATLTHHASPAVRKYSAMASFTVASLHIAALGAYAAAAPSSVITGTASIVAGAIAALLMWAVAGRTESSEDHSDLAAMAGSGGPAPLKGLASALSSTAAVFGTVSLGAGYVASAQISAADPESWVFLSYILFFAPVVAVLAFIAALMRLVLTGAPSSRRVRVASIAAVGAWALLAAATILWMFGAGTPVAVASVVVAALLSLAWIVRGAKVDRTPRDQESAEQLTQ